MRNEELKDFAANLIYNKLDDVSYLGICEAYEEDTSKQLNETDAQAVYELMLRAKVTVSWDD